jgi:hypothetical protein
MNPSLSDLMTNFQTTNFEAQILHDIFERHSLLPSPADLLSTATGKFLCFARQKSD